MESQKSFIYEQLIPYIKDIKDDVRLVHLGDVFDSRSTISTKVATDVVDMFTQLNSLVDEFIVIGGNHDYYSPNSDEVCSLDLLLTQTGATLVTKEEIIRDDMLFIPWYRWGDPAIQDVIDRNKIKHIFAHTDIVSGIIPYTGVNIYSGHMHIPLIRSSKGLFNLGSCYAINFADSNDSRGFYVLTDKLKAIPNKHSIRFWRLYGDDIFDDEKLSKIHKQDYIELYINQNDMLKDEYINKINELVESYKNIWVIPKSSDVRMDLEKFDGFDIKDITRSMIDDDLLDKYNSVVSFVDGTCNIEIGAK